MPNGRPETVNVIARPIEVEELPRGNCRHFGKVMRAHYATRLYRVDCEYGMRHETWYCVGNHMIDNDWLFDRHGLYVTIVERIEPTRTLIAFANDWASNVGPA